MRAVDTNILVRLLGRDDAGQARIADEIVSAGDILLLPAVLLETEWVLRSRYGVPRKEIAARLSALCGQDGVIVVSGDAVAKVLAAYAVGGDFADLLHFALAAELGAATFIAFDRSFADPGEGGLVLDIR